MSDLLPIEETVAEMVFAASASGSDVTIKLSGTADARSHEQLRNLLNQRSRFRM